MFAAKTVSLVLFIFLSFAFTATAQNQSQPVSSPQRSQASEQQQEATRLNAQVVQFYKAGKFNEALKAARQELALREKLHAAGDQQLASVNFNLGAIYLAKKNYRDAAESFEKALTIYQKLPSENGAKIVALLNQIGEALFLSGEKTEAFKRFETALATSEKAFGAEGKETAAQTLRLADVYAALGKIEVAENFYLRAIKINDKMSGAARSDDPNNVRDDVDRYRCFVNSNFESKTAREKIELLARQRPAPTADDPAAAVDYSISSKAVNLAKPPYPAEAKPGRLNGTVTVRVTIDENGDVVAATAICGDPILAAASVAAARQSKFSPTMRSGKPVKISGVLIYTFTAR